MVGRKRGPEGRREDERMQCRGVTGWVGARSKRGEDLREGRGGCGEPRLSMADKRTPLPGTLERKTWSCVCLKAQEERRGERAIVLHAYIL
jgi:hypothetical protein